MKMYKRFNTKEQALVVDISHLVAILAVPTAVDAVTGMGVYCHVYLLASQHDAGNPLLFLFHSIARPRSQSS